MDTAVSLFNNNQAPSYLKQLIVPHHPNRALLSQCAGLLMVPRVLESRTGGRPVLCGTSFPNPNWEPWNQLPVWVREIDTLSTFKIGLETVFFDKASSYG